MQMETIPLDIGCVAMAAIGVTARNMNMEPRNPPIKSLIVGMDFFITIAVAHNKKVSTKRFSNQIMSR